MSETIKLGITHVEQAEASKEVRINDAFDIIDAVAGRGTKSTTGGTTNLTETEARVGLIEITGTLASNATIVYPASLDAKILILNNTTGDFTLVVKYGSGTEYTLPRGAMGLLWQQGFKSVDMGYIDGTTRYIRQHDGTTSRIRAVGPPVTKPLTTGWTARGTALSTSRNDDDGLYIEKSATAGENVCALCRTVPSTPYTITAELRANIFNVSTHRAGLCWYDGTKFIVWGWSQTGGIMASSYNTATSKNGDYGFVSSFSSPHLWLRLTDNGTNHIIYVSYNGVDFIQVDSRSRTVWMAGGPTEVGIFVNPNSATWMAGLHLVSWTQT